MTAIEYEAGSTMVHMSEFIYHLVQIQRRELFASNEKMVATRRHFAS